VQTELQSFAFVGALSARASDDPSHGHYFWTYKAIHEEQARKGLGIPTVIGPKGTNAQFIEPFLSRKNSRKEFRVSPSLPFSYELGRLSKLVRLRRLEGISHYFSYDGGLSDFLITYWLALRNPGVHFTFNFHWADQWMSLLSSKRLSAALTRALLAQSLHNAPSNLRCSAETRPFAEELSSALGCEFSVFPIFSTNIPQKARPWERRSIDVLFLPQRRTEMDFVARASRALASSGISVLTALKPDTWTRWTGRHNSGGLGAPRFLPLESKEYEELLLSSRIVVLPYDKPYFRWGSSGKFNEAIAHGCFPLVPQGTAISSQSSGKSSLHEFAYPDEHSLVRLVTQVLSAQSPDDLVPVFLKDFLKWFGSFEISETPKPSALQIMPPGILFVAACFYREQGMVERVFSRLRRARGSFERR